MQDKTSEAGAASAVCAVSAVGQNQQRAASLSAETWAEIRAAYLAGATAGEIRRRWGVAERTLYQHAAAGGWSKKQAGDAAARERARASYDLDSVRDGAIAAHFQDDGSLDDDAADMGARALLASVTAMQQGDVTQARGLVAMAESYYRIAPRQRARLLWHMMDVLSHQGTADELFEGIKDDTHPVKLRYRDWKAERQARERARDGEIVRLKRKLKQVEDELETERAAHARDTAQLLEAWEREPLEDGEAGAEGTSDAAQHS